MERQYFTKLGISAFLTLLRNLRRSGVTTGATIARFFGHLQYHGGVMLIVPMIFYLFAGVPTSCPTTKILSHYQELIRKNLSAFSLKP